MDNYVYLGSCRKPHGIKGGFSLTLENPDDSVLEDNMEIYIKPIDGPSSVKSEGSIQKISRIQFGNKTILYLNGVSNRNDAESMVPFKVFVARELFPKLNDDEFYVNDLIGLDVIDHNTKINIGKVSGFIDNSAQIVLQIKGKKNFDIVFVESFVPVVDLENNLIEVVIPQMV